MIGKIIEINHWIRKKYGVGIAVYPYRTSIDFIKKKFVNEKKLQPYIWFMDWWVIKK